MATTFTTKVIKGFKESFTVENLAQAKKLWKKASDHYYNGDEKKKKVIMSDVTFDKLEAYIKKCDPEWAPLKKTGVAVGTGTGKKFKTPLLNFMPSLSKVYPEAWPKIAAAYTGKMFCLMAKLDGSSLQSEYHKGKLTKVVTRGNGKIGQDISHLIPYLNLPKKIQAHGVVCFRHEAVMKEKTFQKKWSREAAGDDGFDNSRNMVNGLLNRKDAHEALKDVDIVVLGMYGQKLHTGLALAKAQGFTIVPCKTVQVDSKLDMSAQLKWFKAKSPYTLDGLVFAPYEFEYLYKNADKPKGIAAYKENDAESAIEVLVKEIIWQVSGFAKLTPKIKLPEPVQVGAVMVEHATLHNAKWMLDRKIGPGAIVKIVRSGDVIPYITEVVKPAKKPQLPSVPYKKDGVNFIATIKTKEQEVRMLERFFTTLGIDNFAGNTLATLHGLGFYEGKHYFKMTQGVGGYKQLFYSAGFGPKQTDKLFKEVTEKLKNPINMVDLMVASGCFASGVHQRKLNKLVDAGLDLLALGSTTLRKERAVQLICEVPGFQEKTARLIQDGLAAFVPWLREVKARIHVVRQPVKKTVVGPLNGHIVSFTGYRDKQEEERVEALGGVVASFGARTTILLYSLTGKRSSKVDKAGNKAMTYEEMEAAIKRGRISARASSTNKKATDSLIDQLED